MRKSGRAQSCDYVLVRPLELTVLTPVASQRCSLQVCCSASQQKLQPSPAAPINLTLSTRALPSSLWPLMVAGLAAFPFPLLPGAQAGGTNVLLHGCSNPVCAPPNPSLTPRRAAGSTAVGDVAKRENRGSSRSCICLAPLFASVAVLRASPSPSSHGAEPSASCPRSSPALWLCRQSPMALLPPSCCATACLGTAPGQLRPGQCSRKQQRRSPGCQQDVSPARQGTSSPLAAGGPPASPAHRSGARGAASSPRACGCSRNSSKDDSSVCIPPRLPGMGSSLQLALPKST